VGSIRIRGNVTSSGRLASYADYVASNEKQIDLQIPDAELEKLEAILAEAKNVWEKPVPEDVYWPRYQGVKGRVFGSVWTRDGGEARVAIGVAGRSLVHAAQGASPVPSLTIKVLGGPLPYGLKQFRLYTESSKYVSELIHTSILEDFGILSPRQDRVSVRLNGRTIGHMMLLEDIGKHFFEAAQRIEGPVFGFDPDKTSAKFYENFFSVKNFATRSVSDQGMLPPNLADPAFVAQMDTLKLLIIQSYGLTFAAYHGLGQGDMRYHWNARLGTFDPIVKDLDAGIWAPERGDFKTWWAYLSPIAALWRPHAVTIASYYLQHTAAGRKLHRPDGSDTIMALWHTPPSTLQALSIPENVRTFGELLHMWASPWSRRKVDTRLLNALNAMGRQSTYQPVSITQDLVPPEYWAPLGRPASSETSRIGSLIERVTDGVVKPTPSALDVLEWRNSIIKMMAPGTLEEPIADSTSPTRESFPPQILSFLFREEEPDYSNLFFVERNPGDQPVKFSLMSLAGPAYQPKRVREFSGRKVNPSMRMIEINDIRHDERVRLYWFRIPRGSDYIYLQPRIVGDGTVLVPREIVVTPRYRELHAVEPKSLPSVLKRENQSLTFASRKVTIDSELVVPRGRSLVVTSDTEVSFSPNACMIVEGDLDISENARLTLRPAVPGQGWNGIHFSRGGPRMIRNLHVQGVGHGEYQLECGGVKYTGGVSFYETSARISDTTIEDANIEDALHILHSEVVVDSLKISNARSDCIDADFSVLRISNSSISSCKGDGLDVSGSLLDADNVSILRSDDKAISVGENSRAYVVGSLLAESDIGIASKDGSRVYVAGTTIRGTRLGISVFSKKPFYSVSEAHVNHNTVFENNVQRMSH
jgi:hypothetical protein